MVMHARKPARVSDGCNDRRHSQPYQPHKSQPKSQSGSVHRYDKVRDGSSEPTPPYKMLRRSDESPVSRPGEGPIGGRPKTSHALGGKNGTSASPQENPHNNNGAQHSSDPHGPQSRPSERRQEPADDWTEHISSSGKKYYYNCRTEVSQWEKPRDLLEREQRHKDSSKTTTNSFPRDMDYRQEALQDKPTAKSSSGDPSSGPNASHSSSSSSSTPSASQSLSSALPASTSSSSATSSTCTSSSSSSAAAAAALQAQSSAALLQDPALLTQLLPALQATLHMTNGSVDMAKINEALAAAVTQASLRSMLHKLLAAGPSGYNVTALLSQAAAAQHSTQAQPSSQSPVSLTSDTPSPRPYSSPRSASTQSSGAGHKPLMGGSSAGPAPSQSRQGNMSSGKSGPAVLSQTSVEKRPEDPRTMLQRSSQENPSPGPNACGAGMASSSSSSSSAASGCASQPQPSAPGSFTPSLATHFDENLIRHVQGWPGDHTEKQASRLREDFHNMGSLYMSEICTELKNLRSLVRVCEIQATLREQRILFLRQQSKELDKLKNQNSYMV